jgi:hypothetical protein
MGRKRKAMRIKGKRACVSLSAEAGVSVWTLTSISRKKAPALRESIFVQGLT